MSKSYQRFEILLPLRFNDGQPVPAELIGEVALKLQEQFGAVSSETQTIRGAWSHQGEVYRDDHVRIFVDVKDKRAARRFFGQYKEELKRRFQQLDIWITSYPLEVL